MVGWGACRRRRGRKGERGLAEAALLRTVAPLALVAPLAGHAMPWLVVAVVVRGGSVWGEGLDTRLAAKSSGERPWRWRCPPMMHASRFGRDHTTHTKHTAHPTTSLSTQQDRRDKQPAQLFLGVNWGAASQASPRPSSFFIFIQSRPTHTPQHDKDIMGQSDSKARSKSKGKAS